MTAKLNNAPIEKTFNDLQATAGNLRTTLDRINNGEGSIGAMLNDKSLYYRLDTTLNTFSFLAEDLKKHPSRYINLTIFGRRAKTAQEMGTER
jgi:phospholipid/cholesterol/gamma-HCH transport system substrate-binding protein